MAERIDFHMTSQNVRLINSSQYKKRKNKEGVQLLLKRQTDAGSMPKYTVIDAM